MKPQQERIISYLEGEMEAAERSRFEADLQKDTALRQEFEQLSSIMKGMKSWGIEEAARRAAAAYFHEKASEAEQPGGFSPEIRVGIAAFGRERLMEKAKAAEAQFLQEKTAKAAKIVRMRRLRWVLAAAASVVLVVGVWQWLSPSPQNELDGIYADHTSRQNYMPHINKVFPTRQGQGFKQTRLEMGIEEFRSGSFQAAIDALRPIEFEPEAALFMGLSYQQLGDVGMALSYFEKAQQNDKADSHSIQVQQLAQYNIALCLLKLGRKQDAIPFLVNLLKQESRLQTENPSLYEEVQKLRSRL